MQYIEESTGTTIMAVTTTDGVIIAADTRTSSGSYVSSKLTDKLTKITDRIYCCRSGSAADTQIIARIVRNEIEKIERSENKPVTVRMVANLIKHFIYNYKLLAGIIVAGYDDVEGGAIYSIKLGGTIIQEDISLGGSGSLFIYGYCDSMYRKDMLDTEKEVFVKDAVRLAIKRDGASGGCIRMGRITKDGISRVNFKL